MYRYCILGALLALPAIGCDSSPIQAREPFEGCQRTVFVDRTGKHELTYRFLNQSSESWSRPEIFTSCACHDVRFVPEIVSPGATATLTLSADLEPKGIVDGNIQIRWVDGALTRLDWSIALERFRGLQVSPPSVAESSLQKHSSLTCAFLASDVDDAASLKSPLVRRGNHEYPAEIRWIESAGSGLAKGEFMIAVPAGVPGSGPFEVLFANQQIEVEIY